MTDSPLGTLPTTRRAILNLLKRQGPLAANEMAHALGLTPAAVRMQLARLEDDGLLARDGRANDAVRRGRPMHHYTLTAAAEALYNTESPASFSLFTIGSLNGNQELWSVRVPYLLSLIATLNPHGTVQGINNVERAYVKKYGPGGIS